MLSPLRDTSPACSAAAHAAIRIVMPKSGGVTATTTGGLHVIVAGDHDGSEFDMTSAMAVISTLIAAAGLGFSGWQLRLIHKEREKDRELGIGGVCLSWQAVIAPNKAEVDNQGNAVWTYVFRLDNPGRFPISEITARVNFPSAVSRIRHNGVVDDPNLVLKLAHPVLPGGGSLEWAHRRLKMRFDKSPNRPGIRAEVSFLDSEGTPHTTIWPVPRRDS